MLQGHGEELSKPKQIAAPSSFIGIGAAYEIHTIREEVIEEQLSSRNSDYPMNKLEDLNPPVSSICDEEEKQSALLDYQDKEADQQEEMEAIDVDQIVLPPIKLSDNLQMLQINQPKDNIKKSGSSSSRDRQIGKEQKLSSVGYRAISELDASLESLNSNHPCDDKLD